MPKRRPTIPISHGDADDVRMIALTDQEWQAIEYEYGRQLNAEVRQQITTVTTQYLKDRGFERAAAPKEMARKRIERIRRAAGDLESVMLNREAFSASSPEPEPEAKTTSGGDEEGKPKEAEAIPGQLAPADTAEKSAPEEKPAETAEEKSSEPAEERGAENGTETAEEKPAATEAEATQRAEGEEEGNQRGDELSRQQRQSAHSYADRLIRRHLASPARAEGLDKSTIRRAASSDELSKQQSDEHSYADGLIRQHLDEQSLARHKLHHFRDALKSLVVACDYALGDLSATKNSDDEPWNWWIQGLTRIAQRHRLPYGARIGARIVDRVEVSREPSPFVALVRALQKHVPARHMFSDEALAKAIQRAQGRARDK
jgi:hypothetical protein